MEQSGRKHPQMTANNEATDAVDGSSPPEGSVKAPEVGAFVLSGSGYCVRVDEPERGSSGSGSASEARKPPLSSDTSSAARSY
jgi:hypothetical protein